MTNYGQPDAWVLLGGYNLTGTLTQFTHKQEAVLEQSDCLGDSWLEHSWTGMKSAELTQEGFYDDAALSQHAAAEAKLATGSVLCHGVEGQTTGKNFTGWSGALQINYERVVSRGELHKANAEYRNQGLVEQGRILRPLSGATASGNTTGNSIDFTASNTSGGAAYFQLTSFSSGAGTTALKVEVLHSADNLTFTTWNSFTPATMAPLAERVASTAKLERYAGIRFQGTTGGGGFPASAIFFVGLVRF